MADMLTGFSLTLGTVMFLGGALLLTAAVILSFARAVTAGKRKRKLDERMKEIY